MESNAGIGIIYINKHKSYLTRLLNAVQHKIKDKNLSIICFQMNDLNLENDSIKGMLVTHDKIRETRSSIPKIIFNLGYFTLYENKEKLKMLRMDGNIHIINPINRFNQLILFDMLQAFNSQFILPYKPFNKENVLEFIEQYHQIYITPENKLSTDNTIKIKKRLDRFIITDGKSEFSCEKNKLLETIDHRLHNKNYIIIGDIINQASNCQKELQLSIQKDGEGKWVVSNIKMKKELFPNKPFAINVKKLNKLKNSAIEICSNIENYLNFIGFCTLDFIINETGNYYLIYIGGWENSNLDSTVWEKINILLDYLIYLNKEVSKND